MGNICNNGNLQKQQTTQTVDTFNKNFPICQFTLKNTCKIHLILGTYRYHKSQTLLLITQIDYLQYCPQLRQYAQNFNNVIDQVVGQRKRLLYVNTNRNCPYKKIQLCILPTYNSNQFQAYFQQFQNMIQQIITINFDITLQLSFTSDNLNGLPNQTLIAQLNQIIKYGEVLSYEIRKLYYQYDQQLNSILNVGRIYEKMWEIIVLQNINKY